VLCGHEYTQSNLRFARHVEPENEAMKDKERWAYEMRNWMCPTIPSSIGEEKKINPFMRVNLPEVQAKVGAVDAIDCMKKLREMKNNFKP